MNRRSFVTALFGGIAASAVGASIAIAPAEAASLQVDQAALDAVPAEFSQYWRRPRRRRQVCTFRRNRFGRRVRVCRTVYY